MAYFKPYIDAAGLHVPTYIDIRDDLVAQFKEIYGQDIYLDNDSQDYQMIAVFALKTYDAMQMLQIIYNNRGPKTAVGSALDGIIKINGLKRKSASYSTCVLTITGDIGTSIRNGIAEDESGVQWILPDVVTLTSAVVKVTARCKDIGAIEALPSTIIKIVTPTKGWLSVTNEVAAVRGMPVETDAEARVRQSISVAIPSQAMLDSLIAGIANINGVKRYRVYENDTNIMDEKGVPGHTIACVVEGGLEYDIGKQIYLRKAPGCGTFGTTTAQYVNSDGLITNIRFFRPEYTPVYVSMSIKPLVGYSVAVADTIKARLTDYLNNLQIGFDVTITSALAAALSALTSLAQPTFSVTEFKIGTAANKLYGQDINILYTSVAKAAEIVVTEA